MRKSICTATIIVLILVITAAAYSALSAPGGSASSGNASAQASPEVTVSAPRVGKDVGNIAPDFTLSTTNGRSVTLSSFQGKQPVFISFWSVTCPYCLAELASVKQMYADYAGRIAILPVAVGSSAASVKQVASHYAWPFEPVVDLYASAFTSFGGSAVPYNVFIDRNGVIVDSVLGMISEKDLRQKLDSLLTSGSAGAQ